MRYIDQIKTLPPDAADSPLILGDAMHTGIEQGVEAGISKYFSAFPIITDAHINEEIKLEYWIPRVQAMIPPGAVFEKRLSDEDFIGFIDLTVPAPGFHDQPMPDLYDLYDFKYAANASRYADSEQLHLYKYWFEKLNPNKKIRNLYYLVIPKVGIKQKAGETLAAYRTRIEAELEKRSIQLIPVQYDPEKVIHYLLGVKHCMGATQFPENTSFLCGWCEYQDYCKKGEDYMLLPKNERRTLNAVTKRVVWLYGAPFSGKTFFANEFPDPLMLNTDGNIKFVDAPYIPIRDEVTINGRMTIKKPAWECFKEILDELEKKQNTFKTIVVDLLEDLYEHCRLYMYKQLNITHESDDSFRAWDKVRTEFLSTIKRLMNLDYENIILISHEDTSKDITKRDGKVTAIKPNIQDKIANKVAGMVDVVARIIADGDNRVLSFKCDEVVFGGGRLTVREREIPLDYAAFAAVYDEANQNAVKVLSSNPKPDVNRVTGDPPARVKRDTEAALAAAVKEQEQQEAEAPAANAAPNETPAETPESNEAPAEPAADPAPIKRQRKRRE